MNINKILSFFRIKKHFKVTVQEQKILEKSLENPSLLNQDRTTIDLDNNTEDQDQYFETLLLDIYEEVQNSSPKIEDDTTIDVTFSTLESYKILQSNHPDWKKEFLYFLLKKLARVKKKPSIISENNVPNTLILSLVNLFLNAKLNLKSDDFITFINFWKSSYPFQFNLKHVLKHLKNYSAQNLLTIDLVQTLSSFLRSNSLTYLSLEEYMYAFSTIKRVLLNHPQRMTLQEDFIFQFLPDHLGVYGNKIINGLSKEAQFDFSKIIFLCVNNSGWVLNTKTSSEVFVLTKKLGTKNFEIHLSKLLKQAAYFRLRKVTLRNHITKHSVLSKTYGEQKPMFKENIKIMSGLVQFAGKNQYINCIPHILKILKRCYSSIPKDRMGPTSQSLGKICIQTLYFHYGEQGKQELKKLYQETTYKSIKTEILNLQKE